MEPATPNLFPRILLIVTLVVGALMLLVYVEDEQGDTSCGGG